MPRWGSLGLAQSSLLGERSGHPAQAEAWPASSVVPRTPLAAVRNFGRHDTALGMLAGAPWRAGLAHSQLSQPAAWPTHKR